MHKLLILAVAAVVLAGCDKVPGNISKTQPVSNDPAPPRLEPVIHCAPDTTAMAMAGLKTFDVAACTPPVGVQRS